MEKFLVLVVDTSIIRTTSAKSYKRHFIIDKNPTIAPTLEALMQSAIAGDKVAYANALRQSAILLRKYLARKLSDQNDLEDLVQEILISVHKARHTYDGMRPYKPWLFAIASFRFKDYLRKFYADRLRDADCLDDVNNFTYDVTESELTYESIKGEIDNLSGKQPQILHLIHSEGHTAKEVAVKMNMSESAVKVAAHRAYKILKEKLVSK